MTTQRRWSGPPLGRLAVMGAGQIGGSVALAARAAGAVTDVVAWSRTQDKLDRARALGIIDRAASSAAEAARGAALVVLATPVRSLGELAAEIAPVLEPGALLIDVGSVKAAAIAAIEPKLAPGAYVACHPVAGIERVGPDAASPLLFEGKRCVICPTPHSREESVVLIERLWTAMGAGTVRMDAELHDRVLGAGSHLPHVAAYALAATLGGLPPDLVEGLRRLPTSSLRDTTRVAASSPSMWRDIFLDNRDEVLPLIDALMLQIEALRQAIAGSDGGRIAELLEVGKAGRDRVVPG
jgi:prephenate dehydrogenase